MGDKYSIETWEPVELLDKSLWVSSETKTIDGRPYAESRRGPSCYLRVPVPLYHHYVFDQRTCLVEAAANEESEQYSWYMPLAQIKKKLYPFPISLTHWLQGPAYTYNIDRNGMSKNLGAHFPPQSKPWQALRRLFAYFNPDDYIFFQKLNCSGISEEALLRLNFWQVGYEDESIFERFYSTNTLVNQVMETLEAPIELGDLMIDPEASQLLNWWWAFDYDVGKLYHGRVCHWFIIAGMRDWQEVIQTYIFTEKERSAFGSIPVEKLLHYF